MRAQKAVRKSARKKPGTDREGRTPLHYAALDNDVALVRRLLAFGADVNAEDRNGFTPLHFAAQEFAIGAAKALLKAGASVDSRNRYGNSPLSTATYESCGRGQMIKLLRSAGADPWLRNNYGVSPVSLARIIANYDVAQFFDDLPIKRPRSKRC